MESNKHLFPWLEFINRPAFCVKDGIVLAANSAAQKLRLQAGADISEIVTQNHKAYEKFHSGSLFLTITVDQRPYSACVTRTNEFDIFTIMQTEEDSRLQALALAAQQLRTPLSNMMTVTDRLLAGLNPEDFNTQQQVGQINRSLFQMLRIISNMSDADSYKNTIIEEKQTVNFTTLFHEIMEKIQTVSESAQRKLSYNGPDFAIFGLADDEKLGRAIYNLISNALKFSPEDSTVEVNLSQNRNMLTFTVCNTNLEPVEDFTFWSRYTRHPSIEDGRFGLGLGMTLISSVACAHGGTVLVDHPTPEETRITMTIAITKDDTGILRSPVFRIGDYAGGRDKELLELSETLPTDSYKKIN